MNMHAPTLDRLGDTVHDVAHTVAERAPDIATAVGRSARSAADTVSDTVTKLAAKTPWVEAPVRKRHGPPVAARIAIVAMLAGLVFWFVSRRRHHAEVDEVTLAPDAAATRISDRRYATAGR